MHGFRLTKRTPGTPGTLSQDGYSQTHGVKEQRLVDKRRVGLVIAFILLDADMSGDLSADEYKVFIKCVCHAQASSHKRAAPALVNLSPWPRLSSYCGIKHRHIAELPSRLTVTGFVRLCELLELSYGTPRLRPFARLALLSPPQQQV